MRVLVTNDDGIDSPGLVALVHAARAAGLAPFVAAPSHGFSGASAALTGIERDGRILVRPHRLAELPEVQAYSVAASPDLIVVLALHGGLGPIPDLVLSGINEGANAGRAVTHSGTVGAALTAALDGRRAAAFSLSTPLTRPEPPRWDTATTVVAELLRSIENLPSGVVLNVNVPNVAYDDLRGWRRAALAEHGSVMLAVREIDGGDLQVALRDRDGPAAEDSDEHLLAQGHVTITPVRPLAEAVDVPVPRNRP